MNKDKNKKKLEVKSKDDAHNIKEGFKISKKTFWGFFSLSLVISFFMVLSVAQKHRVFEKDPVLKIPSMMERTDHNFNVIDDAEGFMDMLIEGIDGAYIVSGSRCLWCSKVLPILDSAAADNGVKVNYLDTKLLKDNEDAIEKLSTFEKESGLGIEEEYGMIPVFVVIKDKKPIALYNGIPEGLGVISVDAPLAGPARINLYNMYNDLLKDLK